MSLAGITRHPTESGWSKWRATRSTKPRDIYANIDTCYMIATPSSAPRSEHILATGNVKCLALPPRSPNLNAFAERWVRSVKQECLSKLILFGEGSLRRALTEFLEHYHAERNHQGKGNVLLFPSPDRAAGNGSGRVRCQERLGGLLKFYYREAA